MEIEIERYVWEFHERQRGAYQVRSKLEPLSSEIEVQSWQGEVAKQWLDT